MSRIEEIKQYFFVLWELTKRELKRKYARSFFGILWSSIYPLFRMILVVLLFSTIFDKGIDRYPAYYFVGFLMYEFFITATSNSLTTLKDNRDLLIKSKLPRELLVLSRVLTAFVNFLLGCIPFALVLVVYDAHFSFYYAYVPIILILFVAFTAGISYMLSIWYVFRRDARNIWMNFTMIMRFFIALFYHITWVSKGVQAFIRNNPIYGFIYTCRNYLVYGEKVETFYLWEIGIWTGVIFVLGFLIFRKYENEVVIHL
ncbi:MAG: ABC transporter permease [Lachnospiraceae bacterium]|nr:ABC transporter permease [Lachnospiraceae bacterium]